MIFKIPANLKELVTDVTLYLNGFLYEGVESTFHTNTYSISGTQLLKNANLENNRTSMEQVIEDLLNSPITMFDITYNRFYTDNVKLKDIVTGYESYIFDNSYHKNITFKYNTLRNKSYNINIPILKSFSLVDSSAVNAEKIRISYIDKSNRTNILEFLSRYDCSVSAEKTIMSNNIGKNTKVITCIDTSLANLMSRSEKYHTHMNFSDSQFFFNPNYTRVFNNASECKLNLSHIIALLGYDTKDIAKDMAIVRKMKETMNIIGLGGTMSNFLYWANELRKLITPNDTLFKKVEVYDDDTLELSNLPRIPLNWFNYIEKDSNPYKVKLLNHNQNFIEELHIFNQLSPTSNCTSNGTIYIGTPTIDYRTTFSSSLNYFLCPTHSFNNLKIFANPVLDTTISNETYGSIKLPFFFLNMIKMTIELIKALADYDKNRFELNIKTKEKLLLDFDIVKDNKFKEISANHKELKKYCYIFN